MTRTLIALLLLCAILRHAVTATPRPDAGAPAWRLPLELDGARARPAPLSRSERALAARQGVTLSRVDYGSSQVALVTTTGVKELHPPEACLRAAGYEIVTRREEPLPRGCALRYELRRAARGAEPAAWLYVTYLEAGQARTSCSGLARLGRAAWHQLAGRVRASASLEVMDRDRRRARERTLELCEALAPN